MSQLIHMRQRIKTVETIKRITNAMRLISRSSHFHLSKKRQALHLYHQSITNLFFKAQSSYQQWQSPLTTLPSETSKTLYILVSAHKGLCGNFNSGLFTFFNTHIHKHQTNPFSLISVGKKAHAFAQANFPHHEIATFVEHSATTITAIAQEITNAIINIPIPYTQVYIVGNKLKNFFIYYPYTTTLIPVSALSNTTQDEVENCIIEGNPQDMLNQLLQLHIHATIQTALFESLLAEQAARFISMDSATRNADTILDNTRMAYNKLRQAKITKDMIELSSSY